MPELNLKTMNKYFINTRPFSNGYHVVHKQDCPLLPEPGKRILLGVFQSPDDAINEGKNHFRKPVCCRFCSKEGTWSRESQESEVKAGAAFISSDNLTDTIEGLMFCSVS